LSLGDKSRVHGPDRSGKLTFQGDRGPYLNSLDLLPARRHTLAYASLSSNERACRCFRAAGATAVSLIAPERELEPSRARTSAVSCRPARRGKLGVHYAVSRPGRNQVRSLANSWRGEA
jgi:hypothetical protein